MKIFLKLILSNLIFLSISLAQSGRGNQREECISDRSTQSILSEYERLISEGKHEQARSLILRTPAPTLMAGIVGRESSSSQAGVGYALAWAFTKVDVDNLQRELAQATSRTPPNNTAVTDLRRRLREREMQLARFDELLRNPRAGQPEQTPNQRAAESNLHSAIEDYLKTKVSDSQPSLINRSSCSRAIVQPADAREAGRR